MEMDTSASRPVEMTATTPTRRSIPARQTNGTTGSIATVRVTTTSTPTPMGSDLTTTVQMTAMTSTDPCTLRPGGPYPSRTDFYADSLSGNVVALPSAGGNTSCSFSRVHIRWDGSSATSFLRRRDFSGLVTGDCGASIYSLLPSYMYHHGAAGYANYHFFSSAWWDSPYPYSFVFPYSIETGWFANRTLLSSFDNRVWLYSGPYSSRMTISGSIFASYQLLGESHELGITR